jgi:uncharacterized protein (TIGR00255 family)
MTGFGRAEKVVDGRDIIVEVKSVNHRFFDFNIRASRGYEFLEEKVRPYLQEKIARGKLDVYVGLEKLDDAGTEVQINMPLAAGYLSALRAAQKKFGLPDDIKTSTLLQCPDIFTVRREPEDEEEVWGKVKGVLDEALVPFFAMRRAEGSKMQEDILSRVSAILKMVGEIEERSPKTVEEYRSKLKERIQDLLGSAPVDEQRILTEAAIYADKVSVAEETVRLRSHISQFTDMVSSGEAVGRRLDFLVQEMNREANTIGSKCVDAQIAHLVVDMKAEIEKIREQIQNIE